MRIVLGKNRIIPSGGIKLDYVNDAGIGDVDDFASRLDRVAGAGAQ